MSKEIWRATKYPGYKVSTIGRVRIPDRLDRRGRFRRGYITHGLNGRYRSITVYHNNITKRIRVHILVLETFVGPRPLGYESRHLNDIEYDNRLSNLAWGTRKQNKKDAILNGKIGKLTDKEVVKIRRLYIPRKEGHSLRALARRFDVSPPTIRDIVMRKRWRHV